jgi:FMN phosphatase YigB (HAD superfamily)
LLDVDGVLVRDRLLLEHVKSNCIEYVRAKLPECKDPATTNRYLHLTHGHTARGIQTLFNLDVSDFNEKVYDKRLLEHLADVIYGPEFQNEMTELFDVTSKGCWDVTLFSNAPSEWVKPIALAIGGDTINVSCCGSNAHTSFLKPELAAYSGFSSTQTHLYVDDSLKNLGAVRRLPNWQPVLFNQGEKEPRLWCQQIGNMWELRLLLDSLHKAE